MSNLKSLWSIFPNLADDTIQINETHPESGGRYKAPTFLKRSRLPKENDLLVSIPGSLNEKTILNVIQTPGTGRRKKNHLITDNRDQSRRIVQYFDASDFCIGEKVKICGKEISKQNLLKHKREIHEGIRFPCSICGKLLATQGNLQLHVKNVHEDKEDSDC